MRIGILGTGDVGRSLGNGFLTLGHEVTIGAREAAHERAAAWAKEGGPRARHGTFADAARAGEWVVLAVPGAVAEGVLRLADPANLRGKVVLDATNPLTMADGVLSLAVGHSDSLGERVQRALPGASVVKVFNTVGHEHMFRPDLAGGPPTMPLAGDDERAKRAVAELLTDFGWGALDLGGIAAARYLEPMAMVWITVAMRGGSRAHAFKLLRR